MTIEKQQSERRHFLKSALAASSAVALSTVTGGAQAAVEEKPVAAEPAAEAKGYQKTPHVERFYQSLKF